MNLREFVVIFASEEWGMWIFYACFFFFDIALSRAAWPKSHPKKLYISICYNVYRYGLAKWPSRDVPVQYEFFWKKITLYAIFTIIMCMHIECICYELVNLLMKDFLHFEIFSLLAIISCCFFTLLLLNSTLNLISLKENALQATRYFVLAYCSFCVCFPFFVVYLCTLQNGMDFNFNEYQAHWPQSHMYGSLIISFSWYLYFKFSIKIEHDFCKLSRKAVGEAESK